MFIIENDVSGGEEVALGISSCMVGTLAFAVEAFDVEALFLSLVGFVTFEGSGTWCPLLPSVLLSVPLEHLKNHYWFLGVSVDLF
jgi:hypothetical protein